jgi:hypothetical protein
MKRTWAGLLTLTLLVGIAPQIATAAVKAGATCTKLKSTTKVSGYKYTCIKSGKKLVWSKGVRVVATPKPTASPTTAPSATAMPTPSASATPASTSADKYSDQPCKTEGEDLRTETASYKCVKRTDSGTLLWSKNNTGSGPLSDSNANDHSNTNTIAVAVNNTFSCASVIFTRVHRFTHERTLRNRR